MRFYFSLLQRINSHILYMPIYKTISKNVTYWNQQQLLTVDSRQQVILFNFFEHWDQATLKKG